MKYIPILTHNSENETAFEIRIISIEEKKEVGIGAVVLCKNEKKIKMVQCEYYVPEKYEVSEKEIEKECKKIIKSMRKFEKDG
ncbi:MAG: hypothetical protein J6M60_04885 [Clostridia bacterium]|nr:hypothetical protein [Clostridia bacterium]